MEGVLQGRKGVIVYIDDILVGVTEEEHLKRLDDVLSRLEKAGLPTQKCKCKFMVPLVSFLGHKIDGEGLLSLPSKVDAVLEVPTPLNT